jgi:undecaprenyl-phosphate 4-deoxy-4-formamido-L-arabinose transferase
MNDKSVKAQMISIVIPTYRSYNYISTTIARIVHAMLSTNYDYELLIVDDGSSDGTWEKIVGEAKNSSKIQCFQLERNYGQHAATLCGLRSAAGDFVVTLDDDLQHNPIHIVKLVDRLVEGNLDLVIADFDAIEKSLMRRLGTITVNRFVSRTLGKSREIKLSAFRAFTKVINQRVVATKNPKPYITGELLLASSRIENLNLDYEKRFFGESTYTAKSLANLFIQIVLNYSLLPLRMVIRLIFILIVSTPVLMLLDIKSDFLIKTWLVFSILMIAVITKYLEKIYLNVVFPVQYQVKQASERTRIA